MQQNSSGDFLLGESKCEREERERKDQHLGTRPAEEKREGEETDTQAGRQTDRQGRGERWEAGTVNSSEHIPQGQGSIDA